MGLKSHGTTKMNYYDDISQGYEATVSTVGYDMGFATLKPIKGDSFDS